jgi:large subunit ribosomal protein L21
VDLRDDAKPGDEIRFAEVLCVGGDAPRFGAPAVKGAAVVATVVGEAKGPKLVVFKMRRRKNSRRRQGHRAKYTEVRITRIEG